MPKPQTFLRRQERIAENQAAFLRAEEEQLATFKCLCECVRREECEETFALTREQYTHAREIVSKPTCLVVAIGHVLFPVERIWREDDHFAEVFAPNPPQREQELDNETLKRNADLLLANISNTRTDLTAVGTRTAGAMASAALILGVFASLGPDRSDTTALVLLALALIPFSVIALTSIGGPIATQEELERLRDPDPVVRDVLERLERWKRDPWVGLREEPMPMHSYEEWERLEAILDPFGRAHPQAHLRFNDWLLWEILLLSRERAQLDSVLESAKRRQRRAVAWLGLLVAYLIIVVIVLQAIG
jgi:hypothetical protein